MKKGFAVLLAIFLCFAAMGIAEEIDSDAVNEGYANAIRTYHEGEVSIESFLFRYVYRAKEFDITFTINPFIAPSAKGLSIITLGNMVIIYDYDTRLLEECTFTTKAPLPPKDEYMQFSCAIDAIERSLIYDSEYGAALDEMGAGVDMFTIHDEIWENGIFVSKGYTYTLNDQGFRIVRNEYKYK